MNETQIRLRDLIPADIESDTQPAAGWAHVQVLERLGGDAWLACPACGSDNLDTYPFSVDSTAAWQRIGCGNCQSDWMETYIPFAREGINISPKGLSALGVGGVRDPMNEGPRFWVDDNINYVIRLDGEPTNYVGLVDEVAGGHIAYGVSDHIENLAASLNRANDQELRSTDETGRHEPQ